MNLDNAAAAHALDGAAQQQGPASARGAPVSPMADFGLPGATPARRSASFDGPVGGLIGIDVDAAGLLYVGDAVGNRVLRIAPLAQ